MIRTQIPIEQFVTRFYHLFNKQWLLLSSGDFSAGQFNCMTVSWGGIGVMWNRPFVMVVVRPQRYTYQFMEQFPTFTLCAFEEQYRPALNLLGTESGRNGDKIIRSGLTPIVAETVAAPIYEQAELAIECQKIYWQDLDRTHFLHPEIDQNYLKQDYHRIYYGQIVCVAGIEKYRFPTLEG